MSTAGAAELVVNVLAFVEDEAEFGVVLEDAGIPFSRLRERADRHHWIRHLGVTANRIVLWRNLARVAQALGLLHAQGMIHGRLVPSAIMTYGDRVPDFKLTGFEWSLWFAAPRPADGHAGVAQRDNGTLAAYSFATDWLCLGAIAADLLGLVTNQEGVPVVRDEGIELIPSEHALVRRLPSTCKGGQLSCRFQPLFLPLRPARVEFAPYHPTKTARVRECRCSFGLESVHYGWSRECCSCARTHRKPFMRPCRTNERGRASTSH